jgi:GTP cyclohydrolase II
MEILVRPPLATCTLPTRYGDMSLLIFCDEDGREDVLALIRGRYAPLPDWPLVRIHSACLTGDILGSLRCDCGPQLDAAMQMIAAELGVLLYLPQQEGRGIGLPNKIRAYALQDTGLDTVDANLALNLPVDGRDYSSAISALLWLGAQRIRLATNNPAKINACTDAGLKVRRVPLDRFVTDHNQRYLRTKDERMGHLTGHVPLGEIVS